MNFFPIIYGLETYVGCQACYTLSSHCKCLLALLSVKEAALNTGRKKLSQTFVINWTESPSRSRAHAVKMHVFRAHLKDKGREYCFIFRNMCESFIREMKKMMMMLMMGVQRNHVFYIIALHLVVARGRQRQIY